MRRMKKKLSSLKGETILETLVALLIITLSVSFLSASIAKSAGIINEVRTTAEAGFVYNGEDVVSLEGKTISDGSTGNVSAGRTFTVSQVPQYPGADENGLYYYFYEP